MKTNKNRLAEEIEDLRCEELYTVYHENRGGHSQECHCGISDRELVTRARTAAKDRRDGRRRHLAHEKDGAPAELSIFSRFFGGRKEMVNLIADCLSAAIDEIESFIRSGRQDAEVYCNFASPVGDCVLEEGNWKVFYPLSAICVIIEHSEIEDRLFHIKTAYPTPSMEFNKDGFSEVDYLIDELDAYFQKRFDENRSW